MKFCFAMLLNTNLHNGVEQESCQLKFNDILGGSSFTEVQVKLEVCKLLRLMFFFTVCCCCGGSG